MRLRKIGLVTGLLLVGLFVSCEEPLAINVSFSKDVFSLPENIEEKDSSQYIAVFGDIQYLTNSVYDYVFRSSLEWIQKASEKINISSILHTGDITQSDDVISEWPYFDREVHEIAKKIPFISAIGDHDYMWEDALILDRNNTHFSKHVDFPNVTSRIEAAFEEGRMENVIIRNEIHGERYDFLVLEFGPRKEVVEWANNWVSSHPDVKYILITHEYLEKGGGRRVKGLKCVSRLRNTTYTTPDDLWERLIKCNDNIVCVLCGHVAGLYAVTFEKNDFGREVCQIQHNIQSPQYRYDNWLMLWTFPKTGDDAIVSIVNTKTNAMYDDRDTLFMFRYKY